MDKMDKEEINRLYREKFGYTYDEMEIFAIPMYAEASYGIQLNPAVLANEDGDMFRIRVHPRTHCQNPDACVIHNPSDHHMRDWPLNWRADRGMMERVDPSTGVGHPDPDDLSFHKSIAPDDEYYGEHGCDGGCVPPTEE